MIKKASRVLGRKYDAQLSKAGLNNTQYAVLRAVKRLTGEPLARIAQDLEMDRTSFYRAIAPMIRDGWLQSEGTGARTRTVRFTAKGKRVFEQATEHWELVQREVIDGFGTRDIKTLVDELRRLSQAAATE